MMCPEDDSAVRFVAGPVGGKMDFAMIVRVFFPCGNRAVRRNLSPSRPRRRRLESASQNSELMMSGIQSDDIDSGLGLCHRNFAPAAAAPSAIPFISCKYSAS